MTQDMTQGKIMPMLVHFTIPLVLGNLFQLTYNAVDSIIVGRYVGKEALAAVGICNPISTLFILFLNGLCMGASILMGNQFGAKDYDHAVRYCIFTDFIGAVHCLCPPDSAFNAGRRVYHGYDNQLSAHYICRTFIYLYV